MENTDSYFGCPHCGKTINYFKKGIRPGSRGKCSHCKKPVHFKPSGTLMLCWLAPFVMINWSVSTHFGNLFSTVTLILTFYIYTTLLIRTHIPKSD